ncbi:hypothetical protein AKJ36_02815 [candidate division MSBL1 archaeon SCGC-AAA259I07]|uniref:Uncharacterized protein n=1 Tax=candidate division MSBL1 archaeon SCGC-AAA259I07 TaxID=1698266 RepID=A0A133UK41_9EURY|nr:hypothetical protein AKJ36_02815 [candidate division MSBL1 archaeon SCGC-AAA259I07]
MFHSGSSLDLIFFLSLRIGFVNCLAGFVKRWKKKTRQKIENIYEDLEDGKPFYERGVEGAGRGGGDS